MTFFNILKPYLAPRPLYCLFIFSVNICNYKHSPIYISEEKDYFFVRIVLMSSIKTLIYGVTLPYSPLFILYDAIFDIKDFDKHLIPFSRYGNNNSMNTTNRQAKMVI